MVNPAVQDLGKQPYLPTFLSLPRTDSQEKQDIAEQSPIKMGLTYCTIQSLSLLSQSFYPLPLSIHSQLSVSLANKPEGRISTVSQVPALALWEGRTLVNGGVVGRRWGNGVCVLGKQGFVGCDCLIPRGLSFHCSSVPYNSTVVRTLASRCSGTRLASSSPCASRTDGCLSAAHRHERNKCLKSSLSLKMSAVENSV